MRLDHAVELIVAGLCIAAGAAGGGSWVSAQATASASNESVEGARGWVQALDERVLEMKETYREKRERQSSLRRDREVLLRESESGFAGARAKGAVAGEAAGVTAGQRLGESRASQELAALSQSGWYMVKVGWRNSQPFIAESWSIDPGPERAYFWENDEAWHRDT